MILNRTLVFISKGDDFGDTVNLDIWVFFSPFVLALTLIAALGGAAAIVRLAIAAKRQWRLSPFLSGMLGMLWVECFDGILATSIFDGHYEYSIALLSAGVSFYALFLFGLGLALLPSSSDRHVTVESVTNEGVVNETSTPVKQWIFDVFARRYAILFSGFTMLVALMLYINANALLRLAYAQILIYGHMTIWFSVFVAVVWTLSCNERSTQRSASPNHRMLHENIYAEEEQVPLESSPLLSAATPRLRPATVVKTPFIILLVSLLLCFFLIAVLVPAIFLIITFSLDYIPRQDTTATWCVTFAVSYLPQLLITFLAAAKDEPGLLAAQAIGSSIGLMVFSLSNLPENGKMLRSKLRAPWAIIVASALVVMLGVRAKRPWARVVGLVMMALWGGCIGVLWATDNAL